MYSGHPVYNGHLAISQGWPLCTGWTVIPERAISLVFFESNILPIDDKKRNECHAINNVIFLNKSQAEKSRKLDNERITLSTANFRTAGFPLALAQTLQVLASSCLPQQIFLLASKTRPKNSPQLPKRTRNTRKIANKFMTVASGEINLRSGLSHLSRSESESCKVSAFHGWCNSLFLAYFDIPTRQ